LLLLLVVASAYPFWRHVLSPPAEAEAQLVTATVGVGNIEDAVTAVGNLVASESRIVRVGTAGVIDSLEVGVGEVVAAGDVVARLDTIELEAAVRTAEAQLANLEASLADREAQLALAQDNLARQEELYRAQAVAETTLQSARANVSSATAQLESVRSQLVQAEISLATAERNLEGAVVVAPIDGTVVSLSTEVGQRIDSGDEVMAIADYATMTVEAQVSEADVARLYDGMPAYFTTLSNSGRRWNGTLRQILPTPEVTNNVVLYTLLFEVPNDDGALRLGMSAQVFFVVASASNVTTVSVAALQPAGAALAGAAAGAEEGGPATPGAGGGATPPVEAGAVAGPGAAGARQGVFDQLPEGVDRDQVAQIFANGGPAGPANGQLPEGVDPAQFAQRFRGDGANANAANNGNAAATRYSVRVVQEDGTVETRLVEIGARDRLNAEVIGGLAPGEQVVVGTTTAGTQANSTAQAPGGGGALFAIPGGAGGRPF
jgi:macrolide-specific efflux system membrane fusion protein